jgi:hypothetical protein
MNISNEMSNYEQIVILRDKAKLFDKIVDSYFKTHVCVWESNEQANKIKFYADIMKVMQDADNYGFITKPKM